MKLNCANLASGFISDDFWASTGTMKEGRYVEIKNNRPINSFYATLLEAAGHPVEHFNMGGMYKKYDSGKGPLKELLS